MTDTAFSDDIEQLLALERSRPDEPSEMLERLRDRLATTIGPFDALDAHDPPTGRTPGEAKGSSPDTTATSAAPTSAATAVGTGGLAATKVAVVALGAFAVGAVSGATWQANRAPSPLAPPSIAAPTIAATFASAHEPERLAPTAAVTTDAGTAVDISSLPLVKPTVATAPPEIASAATKDPLGAERTLIDVARTASSRGKMTEAMAALDEHAARFPRGALSEEREGLRIQLLLAQGRTADARARATSFRKNFPTSLMLPAIDAQLNAAPAPSTLPSP